MDFTIKSVGKIKIVSISLDLCNAYFEQTIINYVLQTYLYIHCLYAFGQFVYNVFHTCTLCGTHYVCFTFLRCTCVTQFFDWPPAIKHYHVKNTRILNDYYCCNGVIKKYNNINNVKRLNASAIQSNCWIFHVHFIIWTFLMYHHFVRRVTLRTV